MVSKNALVGLGLTVGLGVGTAYAVHEVGELNAEAHRIDACVDYNEEHEIPSDSCEVPLSRAEADTLRDTADTTGTLGWIAFFAAFSTGADTLRLINKDDEPVQPAPPTQQP